MQCDDCGAWLTAYEKQLHREVGGRPLCLDCKDADGVVRTSGP